MPAASSRQFQKIFVITVVILQLESGRFVRTVALTVDINPRLHIFAGKVRHGRGRSCYNSRRDTMEWETFLCGGG